MKYISTYEGYDIGDFKTFINKYNKSGGYVSKTDIKRMDASDIKFEYFKNIEKSVDKCMSFFNRNDFELLEDLLQEVYDECPFLNRDKTYKYFELNCSTDRWNHNSFRFCASEDKFSISSREHFKVSSKDIIIDTIVSRAELDIKQKIDKETEDVIKDRSARSIRRNRPGIKSYSELKLDELKKLNPFKNMKISPELCIDFASVVNFDNYNDEDFVPGWNGSFGSQRQIDERIRGEEIMKHTTGQLSRYFSTIGHDGIKFEIKKSQTYNYFQPNFIVDVNFG